MPINKRPSFVNFPIPFDHPYTIPTLAATVVASAWLYHSLQASHEADLKEAIQQQIEQRKRELKTKEETISSLKIEKQYMNPFKKWKNHSVSVMNSLCLGLYNNNNNNSNQKVLKDVPVVKPRMDLIRSKNTFTWLGQSSCIFSIEGLRILADPVFDNDKRLKQSPCQMQDLKGLIDIVLVSHQHFDRLDEEAVIQFGNDVTWYIPLGFREWFIERGIDNVIELDWWQEIHHKGRPDILIACIPSMHENVVQPDSIKTNLYSIASF